jgi:hypothetical protein
MIWIWPHVTTNKTKESGNHLHYGCRVDGHESPSCAESGHFPEGVD